MALPYDPDKHPTPPWRWHDDAAVGTGAGYWRLDGSETDGPDGRRSYECVQYSYAKVRGRRPHRGDSAEAAEAEAIFTALGFRRCDDCSRCGCGDGQCRQCIVIYGTANGGPHHVAVFDPVLCDWGGKLHNRGPIVRFRRPEDFMRPRTLAPDGTEIHPQDTMVCYCRPGPALGPYIADEALAVGYLDPLEGAIASLIERIMDVLRRIADAIRRWFR